MTAKAAPSHTTSAMLAAVCGGYGQADDELPGAGGERYAAPWLHPPFNEEARRRAGFTRAELEFLEGRS